MCGVVGLVAKNRVNQDLFDGLVALQHRGQDAAGIATSGENHSYLHKGQGLVRDVFRARHMLRLSGNMGLAHVRYPTAGSDNHDQAQPFYVNYPYGIFLVHNGNLTNAETERRNLWQQDKRHLNTTSDTEVLLNIFAHALQSCEQEEVTPEAVFAAVRAVHARCRGAYTVIAMIAGQGVVGFRDPYGIRPLVYGQRPADAGGLEYMIASESAALESLGFSLTADVAPGEAIYISADGVCHREQCAETPRLSPCLFEYVYLARQDSVIDGISVYQVRIQMGQRLAAKIQQEWSDLKIDVVMPVPDTSRPAAFELASCLGVPYREGFVKNRYIGRTFIMPGQTERQRSVRRKLNTLPSEFEGKNVLIVDDSIVRGTTCREIIQMARDAGAKQVLFASAAPEVRFPNVYGIDMPAASELIANGRTVDEVCRAVGADHLIYQNLDDLKAVTQAGNKAIEHFEDSVFTGHYLSGDVDAEYLARLEKLRGKR